MNKNIGEIIEKLKLKKAKDRRESKDIRKEKDRGKGKDRGNEKDGGKEKDRRNDKDGGKGKDGGNYKDGGILKKSKGSLTVELALIMCIIILIIEGTICFGIKMYVDSIQTVKKETLKIDSLKLFKNYQKLIN